METAGKRLKRGQTVRKNPSKVCEKCEPFQPKIPKMPGRKSSGMEIPAKQ